VESAILIRDLGITAYADCLALQEDLCAGRQADAIANTVLLTEHEPVVTLGARKSENKLIWTRRQLAEKKIALCPAGRGGGTTAHNPGQIVIYPIIKLKTLRMGLTDYVQTLGRIGIDLLARFGIAAAWRKDAPGLWIGNRKIASVGVQARKWVTMHGMAINIRNDLSIFEAIVPCGLEDVEMTSVLKETGQSASMDEVKSSLSELCKKYLCPAEASVHEQP
jgi:lipoate-protein ligase B